MRAKRVFRRVKRPPFQNGGERQQIESFVRIEWTLLEKCWCEFRLSILPTITRILTNQTSRDTLKRHERNQIVRIHGRYWKSVGVNFAYRSFNITRNLAESRRSNVARHFPLSANAREREILLLLLHHRVSIGGFVVVFHSRKRRTRGSSSSRGESISGRPSAISSPLST